MTPATPITRLKRAGKAAILYGDRCGGLDPNPPPKPKNPAGTRYADPGRIGVMGWSNGGYLTNCMIVAEPDMFAAASSGAGVLDMVIQWGIEDTPGHVVNFVEGLPWEQPWAWGSWSNAGSPASRSPRRPPEIRPCW